MRKLLSKLFPLILAGALLLSAVPAFALWSDAYGDQLTSVPTQLHVGTSLTTETYWSDYYNDRRTENYFVYSPNDDAQVLAYGGDTVTGTSTVLNAANSLAQEGYRVVAGINADFFDGNGTPTGILISGGGASQQRRRQQRCGLQGRRLRHYRHPGPGPAGQPQRLRQRLYHRIE